MENENKQIEEMAKSICENYGACSKCSLKNIDKDDTCSVYQECEVLYNAGYRKASDVTRKIFEEIENALFSSCYSAEIEKHMLSFTLDKLDEAKHKYLNEDFFVKMTGFSEPPIPHTIESIVDLAFPENEGNK